MKKVITYGSFDLFHEGHYKLLKRAKALGDYLIVGVTTEQYDESRGKLNVVDSIIDRIENVKKTGFADKIIVEDHVGQKVEDIHKYGVDTFAIGSDWTGEFDYLKDFCEVVYLERTKEISSTLIRKQKYPIINMGIVGTGRIAARFIPEAKFVSGIETVSVYNPHRESAERFAKRFEVQANWESFEEFLNPLDAVYIASLHQTHYEYAKAALSQGKHVLCEKPMAFSKAQAQELFATAKANDCLLLEAIKTAYCPGFSQLLGVARSGIIGNIVDVEACFTRIADTDSRESKDPNYGGGFLEFGNHTMLPIFKLLGTQYKSVSFDSIKNESGIDLYTKASFSFERGMALSKTGVAVKSEGQLIIAGTKGYILAESPWWLTKSFEVRFENPSKKEQYTARFLGDGLRYELSEFVSLIHSGERKSYKFTEEESVAMAGVVERFMEMRKRK
ncbi:MAG: Gfo/Idh/MocA family oxidoreductase [Hungatella sp.]|jgi:choline-phosphate cytidylyltransferase|nr:Gfo/Idh/MocA family oxidoreductase [Hungatella sp.]